MPNADILRGPLPMLTTKNPATPALVMNCFVPFRTNPSPTFLAVLCTEIASDPELGSVSAQAPRCFPDASGGIQRRFCSSLAATSRWPMHRLLCAASVKAIEPSPAPSSSITSEIESMSSPAPPSSVGAARPVSPSDASSGSSSSGNSPFSLQPSAFGTIRVRTNSRTVSRTRIWSSR